MNCRGYYERGLAWSILLLLKEFSWQLSISLWVQQYLLFFCAVCKCRGFPARLWDGVQLRIEIGVAGRQRKRAPCYPGSPHMQEQNRDGAGNCGTTAADRYTGPQLSWSMYRVTLYALSTTVYRTIAVRPKHLQYLPDFECIFHGRFVIDPTLS